MVFVRIRLTQGEDETSKFDIHHKHIGWLVISACAIVFTSACSSAVASPTPPAGVEIVKPIATVRSTQASTIAPTIQETAAPAQPTTAPVASVTPAAQKAAANEQPSGGIPADYKLVFSDEFDGPQLDGRKWTTCYHWAEKLNGILSCATKNELQLFQPDNVTLENGILRLRVEKETEKVRAYDREHDYTSGMVTSFKKFTFKYGYAEVRARMPKGQGFLSAFWTMPIDKTWPPEIDVIEVLGQDPSMAHLTLHFPKNGEKWKDDKDGGKFRGDDLTAAFNTYAAKWDETGVVWYVNGVERHRTDKSPNEPMYLLATLALGGHWAGPPDAQTPFPAYMEIDYIRVYQK